ncbi:hypothetical protein ABPG72_000476 [Tetrahymena utriculariae]
MQASIINTTLQYGLSQLFKLYSFVQKQVQVDLISIYNLQSQFYHIFRVSSVQILDSIFGQVKQSFKNNTAAESLGFGDIVNDKQNTFSKQNYQYEWDMYINFIELIGSQILIQNTQANFNGYNIRFLKQKEGKGAVSIIQSQFQNMKSQESGGCIGIYSSQLFLTNVIFNQCESQMFGGAIYAYFYLVKEAASIFSCKSKIGGGIFTFLKEVPGIQYTKFAKNLATISSFDYVNQNYQPYDHSSIKLDIFEFDSMYELNFDGTEILMINHQVELVYAQSGPRLTYYKSTLKEGVLYLIRLKVQYQLDGVYYNVQDFSQDQKIGSLYHLLSPQTKNYFILYQINGLNYPYLITTYNYYLDCSNQKVSYYNKFLFQFEFFEGIYNDRVVCYDLASNSSTDKQNQY